MADRTEVLVVGGGPVGTLIAAQLWRFKHSAIVIDKENKAGVPIYGRACTLWCRTLELLDQLDLCEPLLEAGCYTKTGYNYRNGISQPGGLTFGQRMDKHGDTRFGFALHLRQRIIERCFEQVLADYGSAPRHQTEIISYTIDESRGDYPVVAIVKDLVKDEEYEIHSKYIVGADGARSPVRRIAEIPFIGERTGNKWIRLDATVTTNMPSPRTLNSVQSETHGLVLWCPIDEGKTRIGFVWNASLQEKYGEDGATAENVMAEAKKAVAPFTLEFKTLDWHTLYGIGQCIGDSFVKGRVLLAGDAVHTHSSGSAQGLNTGTFDATNMAWKLALVLKGAAGPEVLENYNEERRNSVQQMIDNDKIISSLISGVLPPKFQGRKDHPRDILDEFFENAKTIAFTLGLGVSYAQNNLLNVTPVQPPIASILAGERGPDVSLSRLGTSEATPLQRILQNKGNFNVLIFAGVPQSTQPKLEKMRKYLDRENNFTKTYGPNIVNTLTIFGLAGTGASDVMSGLRPFGKSYYDITQKAHEIYGVDPHQGALVVLRPDGYLGRVVHLDEPELLEEYFSRFLIPLSARQPAKLQNGNGYHHA